MIAVCSIVAFTSGCHAKIRSTADETVDNVLSADNAIEGYTSEVYSFPDITQSGDELITDDTLITTRNEQSESSIKIALIDTGVTRDAINSDHILSGWNYCNNSDDTEDTIGHGTSLAGMILGSDKAGLMGEAPETYIVPLVCQIKGDEGNVEKIEPEMLSQIIREAVDLYGCNIINISAGVKTDYPELKEAVEYADKRGVLVISCAGNEGNSDIYYPGGYDEVLCVGSANKEMTARADFSQDNAAVDLLAPGEKIAVATMKGNVMEVSGTSYSAAYITAVAAALWQNNPGSSPEQIVEYIMEHTVMVGDDRILSLE